MYKYARVCAGYISMRCTCIIHIHMYMYSAVHPQVHTRTRVYASRARVARESISECNPIYGIPTDDYISSINSICFCTSCFALS